MEQLENYKTQIKSVEQALIVASGSQKDDLLDLKAKLEEVVSLLEGNVANNDMDDEFTKFQREISQLEQSRNADDSSDSSSGSESSSDSDRSAKIDEFKEELSSLICSLEGSKCRAPFSREWGEMGYHNALIVSTKYDLEIVETLNDVEVQVMFCNPTCNAMKPCPYFLSGSCKFEKEHCRYSHGYTVKFQEIQEFVLPNLETLDVDSKCLSRGSDGLWSVAVVEQRLENNVFSVKYQNTGVIEAVDADNILPLENTRNGEVDREYEVHEEEYQNQTKSLTNVSAKHVREPNLNFLPPECVEWERHTNGISLKLMEKMGHIWGQGLGKNSDGRIDPIEAVILPAGKSLDKCIELRESANHNGPVSIITRLKVAQDKEEEKAKKIKANVATRKRNVFDFLNSKISRVKDNQFEIKKPTAISSQNRQKKDLNVQIFMIGEEIKKAKLELRRLQKSLVRNNSSSVKIKVENKIAAQVSLLKNLQAEEKRVNQGIKTQSGHKKLAVF